MLLSTSCDRMNRGLWIWIVRIDNLRFVVDGDDAIPKIILVLVNLYARITSRGVDVTSRRCPQPGLCIYFFANHL